MARIWMVSHLPQDLVSAYVDGQVSPEARALVEGHVGTCARCLQELSSLRATVQLLRDLPAVPVPRAFTLSERASPRRVPATPLRGLRLGLAAAVASLALLVAVDLTIVLPTRGAVTPPVPVGMVSPPGIPTTRDTGAALQPTAAAGEPDDAAISPSQHITQPGGPAQQSAAVPPPPVKPVWQTHMEWWPLELGAAVILLLLTPVAVVAQRRRL